MGIPTTVSRRIVLTPHLFAGSFERNNKSTEGVARLNFEMVRELKGLGKRIEVGDGVLDARRGSGEKYD